MAKPTYETIGNGRSNKNVYDVTFDYLWALYRSLDERRTKRFCTLIKNSIEDGSMKPYLESLLNNNNDHRKWEFYKFFAYNK
jgi:hypothetical protein